MPPEEEQPQWVTDAAKALNKAYATGDKKMADDVHGAFDRHCAIENASKDMETGK
jgi:hypothetical protein